MIQSHHIYLKLILPMGRGLELGDLSNPSHSGSTWEPAVCDTRLTGFGQREAINALLEPSVW